MCGHGPPVEKPNFNVVCIGLSKSGKSTLLSVLSGESTDNIEPTIGFRIKALMFNDCIVDVKELGGKNLHKQYLMCYMYGNNLSI